MRWLMLADYRPVDDRTGFGIAAARNGVIFSQSELKLCVCFFLGNESDAIQ